VLVAHHLPELGAHLVAALARLWKKNAGVMRGGGR
jgi:hypothetical protein